MKSGLNHFFLLFFIFSCSNVDQPDPPVKPHATISSLSQEEGNSDHPVYLTVRLDKASSEQQVVILETVDGTATGGTDFVALDKYPLTFEPGDVQNDLRVDVIGDEEFEEDEEFMVRILSPLNDDGTSPEGLITLLNDDYDTTLVIPGSGYVSPNSYAGMELVWSDEFDVGEDLEKNWTFEYGGGGWGNNEWQYYRKENTTIRDGGYLVIEAREESYGGRNYTSSRIITRDKFEFRYGRVDIRACLPFGKGVWPALWMLGHNISQIGWPKCGEIDIMELIGHQPATTHGTIHWSQEGQHAQYGGSTSLSEGIFNDEFHVFSIIWDEEHIEWLLDNKKFFEANIQPAELSEFHQDYFFIFNVAVGGNWPGYPDETTLFPQRMIVDYIRVFQ